jgi:putative membrane protein
MRNKRIVRNITQILLWFLLGLVIGMAAKLPGLSGGALLFAFGLYGAVLETINSPIKGMKKNWLMILCLGAGVGVSYVGLARVVNLLLGWNEGVVMSLFAGMIFGTLPTLWRDSGKKGRSAPSYITLGVSFFILLAAFMALKNLASVKIENPTAPAFMLGGVLQGLSFIVPGLSSSSLLLFLGLEEPINEGISSFDFSVLIPFGIAMVASVLLLSRVMQAAFDKAYSVMCHGVLGFVLATTIAILPPLPPDPFEVISYAEAIIIGILLSYIGTVLPKFLETAAGRRREKREKRERKI